ncbi:F0F1 ATP synthase subunit epsilon [Breoghania sp.]|uniref:F0F1 ATP synthase subunit epsilon n=1 Tax=Breoghania sp. TaxID=2065378 RepID=UPI002AA5F5BB|nr:F0F1 ATP synthase subunit epsilon [Breoghania sp.]
MSEGLHLTVTTAMEVLVDEMGVASVRAEDESGGFGILPGHTEFLTVLPASVMRWRDAQGDLHFCALRGGMLTVRGGREVAVACREGLLGDDLRKLEAEVEKLRAEEVDAARNARAADMRLHAQAVRQLMRYLRPGDTGGFDHPPSISTGPNAGSGKAGGEA